MAKILIVDGHSAIFSDSYLKQIHRSNGRKARQELVNDLETYQDSTEVSVVVVFDGKQGEQTLEGGSDQNILIIYSQQGATADSVIERISGKQSKHHEVLIASNDNAVRETCRSHGGLTMNISELFELIENSKTDFRRKWSIS